MKALVNHFNSTGVGVRQSGNSGSLVEVFLGSKDEIDRYQSKISVMIHLTFKGREKATFMLANEYADETIEGNLSDKGTIDKLLKLVQKKYHDGFWMEVDEEREKV